MKHSVPFWVGAGVLWLVIFPLSMVVLYTIAPGREWIVLLWFLVWGSIITLIQEKT